MLVLPLTGLDRVPPSRRNLRPASGGGYRIAGATTSVNFELIKGESGYKVSLRTLVKNFFWMRSVFTRIRVNVLHIFDAELRAKNRDGVLSVIT